MKGLLGTVVVAALVAVALVEVAAMLVATKAMVLAVGSSKYSLTIELFEIMNFRT